MKCSVCGKDGHNARTCPDKDKDTPRNHALWIKFDNLTEREVAHIFAHKKKEKNWINLSVSFV